MNPRRSSRTVCDRFGNNLISIPWGIKQVQSILLLLYLHLDKAIESLGRYIFKLHSISLRYG